MMGQGRVADEGVAVVEDAAPGRRGRLDAHAQKAQARLQGDDGGDVHGRQDHQRADDIGQHVHTRECGTREAPMARVRP